MFFESLRTLNLSHNPLLTIPMLPSTLESIHLLNCYITSLPDFTMFNSLTHLDLSFNPLLPNSALTLIQTLPESLHTLLLTDCPLQDLSRLPTNLPSSNLLRLSLSRSFIGIHHLRALCNCEALRNLEYLQLRGCMINDYGFKMIVNSHILSKVEVLDLKGNTITDIRKPDDKKIIE